MLDLLETPITVVHVFVCVLLMLVVLIQPGKSGGLGAALGGAGAQQLFGGRGAGNFLSRATWVSAVVFFLTSITLAYIATSTGDSLQDAVAAESEAVTSVSAPKPAAEPQNSETQEPGKAAVSPEAAVPAPAKPKAVVPAAAVPRPAAPKLAVPTGPAPSPTVPAPSPTVPAQP